MLRRQNRSLCHDDNYAAHPLLLWCVLLVTENVTDIMPSLSQSLIAILKLIWKSLSLSNRSRKPWSLACLTQCVKKRYVEKVGMPNVLRLPLDLLGLDGKDSMSMRLHPPNTWSDLAGNACCRRLLMALSMLQPIMNTSSMMTYWVA